MPDEERARKRTLLCAVYDVDGDWREKAAELNIPVSTAYRWVKEGDRIDTRGGRRHFKITQVHREFMVEMIESNAKVTLAEIVAGIQQKFGLRVCKSTVCNHLDAMTYTVKNVHYEPEKANTVENKEKRKQFVQKLLDYQGRNLPIVYVYGPNKF